MNKKKKTYPVALVLLCPQSNHNYSGYAVASNRNCL